MKRVEFKQPVHNPVQIRMKKIISDLKRENKVLIAGDKTGNWYKLQPEEYQRILEREPTKEYKIDKDDTITKINEKNSELTKLLRMEGKMEEIEKRTAMITLKDHYPTFSRESQARLINPSKNPMGILSKQILDKKLGEYRYKHKNNQLRSTVDAITWFRSIQEKKNKTLLKGDIKAFYPNIKPALIAKA